MPAGKTWYFPEAVVCLLPFLWALHAFSWRKKLLGQTSSRNWRQVIAETNSLQSSPEAPSADAMGVWGFPVEHSSSDQLLQEFLNMISINRVIVHKKSAYPFVS